ncbi:MAG: hypothetical protein RL199_218 [Pseudomonadota bacterium]
MAPPPARAAPQLRWRPRLGLAAGWDDNVLFEPQADGDGLGRAQARLGLRAWDRSWRLDGEVGGAVLRFVEHGRTVWLGETTWKGHVQLDRTWRLGAQVRVRAADDPLALAQVGLLAGRGRTLGFRDSVFAEQRLGRRWKLLETLRFDGVKFFDPSAGRDGQAVTVELAPSLRATRALTLRPALEGRVYFQDGVRGESLALVGGVRWRTARRTFVEAGVGPLVYRDDAGALGRAVVRARAQHEWRMAALEATVSHDLTVPAGRGGVLAGQLAEVVGRWGPRDWELRARGGAYRSHPSPRDERWVPGWGYETSAFRRLLPALWVGVSAMRFERLASSVEPAVSRDSLWLRVELGERP